MRLLAERPTLLRLLQQDDTAALAPFLAQFQRTSELDGSAVLRNGRVVASSGASLPWETIVAANSAGTQRFLYRRAAGEPLAQVARAAVPALPGAQVLVATMLDEVFTGELSDNLGTTIRITVGSPAGLTLNDTLAARRRDDLGQYEAGALLRDPTGEVVGTIIATLPTASLELSLLQLTRTLSLIGLAVMISAALAIFLIGRRRKTLSR